MIVVLSVYVLDVAENDDLNDDKDDVAAILCCLIVSEQNVSRCRCASLLLRCIAPSQNRGFRGRWGREVDEPLGVEVVVYFSFFLAANDDRVLFSDVDFDADHVDVVGKVLENDKVTFLIMIVLFLNERSMKMKHSKVVWSMMIK